MAFLIHWIEPAKLAVLRGERLKDRRNSSYFLSEVNNAGRLDGWVSLLLLGLVMAVALPIFGQSTFGSVRGIAQDNSGAADLRRKDRITQHG